LTVPLTNETADAATLDSNPRHAAGAAVVNIEYASPDSSPDRLYQPCLAPLPPKKSYRDG